jgi:hypothetical protein
MKYSKNSVAVSIARTLGRRASPLLHHTQTRAAFLVPFLPTTPLPAASTSRATASISSLFRQDTQAFGFPFFCRDPYYTRQWCSWSDTRLARPCNCPRRACGPTYSTMPSSTRDQENADTPSKKPASTLLPAFEPFSSPALPRPLKRARDEFEDRAKYPTPVPTSSTHIQTSSPSRTQAGRPVLGRTVSTLSERAPLAALPTVELNADGQPIRIGRSSASCDYQLSSNRLVSRVHVIATYKPAVSSLDREKVEIECTGWNGIKVHCKSQVFDVKKGQTFQSDNRDLEIMLDVHDNRVMVQWPEKAHYGPLSSDEEDLPSPSKRQRAMVRHSTPPSPSPVQNRHKPISPVSPSPVLHMPVPSSPPHVSNRLAPDLVEIYEDPDTAEDPADPPLPAEPTQPTQIISQDPASFNSEPASECCELESFSDDGDEENDPIIHSFGPFGANLQARMASMNASDPLTQPVPASSPLPTQQVATSPARPTGSAAIVGADIRSHIVNQLAYSRLASTPLSTILSHLPRDSGTLTRRELRAVIAETECIGEVPREGKDAAGKPLESEYYYVPEKDDDEFRKAAVVNDLRKPGLRACRKQHKVRSSHSPQLHD